MPGGTALAPSAPGSAAHERSARRGAVDPELRDAAFGSRPDAEVWRALRGSPADAWLAAVVLGGQGHYAAASAALTALIHRPAPDLFTSLAASTLASHHRQLGDHRTARRLDSLALATAPAAATSSAATSAGGALAGAKARASAEADPRTADPDGIDALGARADALLGLAADAIGAGRLTEARRLHAAALQFPAQPGTPLVAAPSPGEASPASAAAPLSVAPGETVPVSAVVPPPAATSGEVPPAPTAVSTPAVALSEALPAPTAVAPTAATVVTPPAAAPGETPPAAAPLPAPAPGEPAHSWRTLVRHHWIAAEIALASGAPAEAVPPAEAALALAQARGGMRHILKSRLVLGAALVVWATPESVRRGTEILSCDLNHTARLLLFSLSWPTALVLATNSPVRTTAERRADLDRAANALSCVLLRSTSESRRVAEASPWMPTALLRSGEPPNADPETKFLTD
ncbi:hypothetical protein LV78_003294 [Actinosynnema pretiosum]|nr:hypothetical protein [Actinosynnema pretiosum]